MKTLAKIGALALLGFTLITATLHPANAQSVGGPWVGYNRTIDARDYKLYHVAFYGGETAQVEAWGSGDVDIEVYDEFGNLVAWDRCCDSHPVVTWTPGYTQTYTIKVINAEYHAVSFDLQTN